jgi:exonuclease SbcD
VRSIRFLQLSDVHFGAALTGGRLGLSETAVRRRHDERRDAFARALALVDERDLDGVLIPGDLFDDESVTTDVLRFVLHQFETIAPRPVFIAPGNHDPFGGPSPYEPDSRRAARGLEWPANVILFAHEPFRTVSWPDRPGVAVTGCGVVVNVPSEERRLKARIPREEVELSILLFHGSRDDAGLRQGHKCTYPFSRDELLAQGFDWVALGHYHTLQMVYDDEVRPRGAYAGCLLGNGLDERGDHGVLVVTLTRESTEVEPIRLDRRRIHRLPCDLTGSTFREDAVSRVNAVLQAADAEPDDMVLLELTGRRARGLDLSFLKEIAEKFFHFRVDASALAADVDLDAFPELEEAATTEQRFVARLRDRLEGPDAARARRALLYGLDALHRGRIDTRYEE